MKPEQITDENGINYLLQKPTEGQMCQTKRIGNKGYVGQCKYINGYFETYQDKGNRMEITRWKVDLWLPI
jgi:hypothetical protein